jgi:bifunctional dethiobiotin synthetase / adenosylmethionine---8-amino-7-oxononanoate aminotransferase
VSVYAKVLTGGLVPLAVTLASDDVFRAFEGTSKAEALLHGHSYSAYPVGCEVANAALDLYERLVRGEAWNAARAAWGAAAVGGNEEGDGDGTDIDMTAVWSVWSPQFIDVLSRLDVIEQAMTLGTVLAFKLKGGEIGAVLFPPSPCAPFLALAREKLMVFVSRLSGTILMMATYRISIALRSIDAESAR